jgi:hypothetical protein
MAVDWRADGEPWSERRRRSELFKHPDGAVMPVRTPTRAAAARPLSATDPGRGPGPHASSEAARAPDRAATARRRLSLFLADRWVLSSRSNALTRRHRSARERTSKSVTPTAASGLGQLPARGPHARSADDAEPLPPTGLAYQSYPPPQRGTGDADRSQHSQPAQSQPARARAGLERGLGASGEPPVADRTASFVSSVSSQEQRVAQGAAPPARLSVVSAPPPVAPAASTVLDSVAVVVEPARLEFAIVPGKHMKVWT